MRVVLQRVSRARVTVAGRETGAIGPGYLLLAGFRHEDGEETLAWMADKIISLRLFPDPDPAADPGTDAGADAGADARTGAGSARSSFSRGIEDVGGDLLVVSQFTLYGDARKGRRPGFTDAAPPELAIPLYERFIALLRERAPGRVETGEFGAMMEVELVNDGPVTLLLER
jgi:D-aminoacyl-tRNA deacylase